LAIGWEPSKQRNPAERMSNRLKDRAAIRYRNSGGLPRQFRRLPITQKTERH
jgi:hypothetical protein